MRILSTSIIAIVMASPLFAGNEVVPAMEPKIVTPMAAPAMARDWSGAYVGGQIETGFGGLTATNDPTIDLDVDTTTFGVFGGYRRDFGSVVVGGEIDFVAGDLDLSDGIDSASADIDSLLRAGLEVGYDAGNALIYGTIGLASLSIEDADAESGIFYGIGVDYMITDTVSVGAELLRHEFDIEDGSEELNVDITTIGLNVAYNF